MKRPLLIKGRWRPLVLVGLLLGGCVQVSNLWAGNLNIRCDSGERDFCQEKILRLVNSTCQRSDRPLSISNLVDSCEVKMEQGRYFATQATYCAVSTDGCEDVIVSGFEEAERTRAFTCQEGYKKVGLRDKNLSSLNKLDSSWVRSLCVKK